MPITKRMRAMELLPDGSKIAGAGMELKLLPLASLKLAEYNPRKLTPAQKQQIKSSLESFGLVEPVVVNMHPDRQFVVVGGHQRVMLLQEGDFTHCMCVVVSLEAAREKELNLRLNKNNGEWDFTKLGEWFSEEELSLVGFSDVDLDLAFPDTDIPGLMDLRLPEKLEFSPHINECREYFVIAIRDTAERDALISRLKIGKKKSATGSTRGLQRILSVGEVLGAISQ